MAALDDLLKVIPSHERERLKLASVAQKQLLEFYAQAHKDILRYFEEHFPSSGPKDALSPAQYFDAARLNHLLSFVEARASILNTAVAHALEVAANDIRAIVVAQIAKEASALAIPEKSFGAPDVSIIEKKIDDAVSRIQSWNGRWSADLQNQLKTGILRGESYREISNRVGAVSRTNSGESTAVAKARAHMLANVRYAVVNASNAARQEAYQGAIDEGTKVQKLWWANIENCCISCAKLHGQIVDMDKDFRWKRLGLRITPFEERLPHPPLHPNCRCRILPVTVDVLADIDTDKLKVERTDRLEVLAGAGIH